MIPITKNPIIGSTIATCQHMFCCLFMLIQPFPKVLILIHTFFVNIWTKMVWRFPKIWVSRYPKSPWLGPLDENWYPHCWGSRASQQPAPLLALKSMAIQPPNPGRDKKSMGIHWEYHDVFRYWIIENHFIFKVHFNFIFNVSVVSKQCSIFKVAFFR